MIRYHTIHSFTIQKNDSNSIILMNEECKMNENRFSFFDWPSVIRVALYEYIFYERQIYHESISNETISLQNTKKMLIHHNHWYMNGKAVIRSRSHQVSNISEYEKARNICQLMCSYIFPSIRILGMTLSQFDLISIPQKNFTYNRREGTVYIYI